MSRTRVNVPSQHPLIERSGLPTSSWLQFFIALWHRGYWTPVKFDATCFTASDAMTWTVQENDQTTLAYTLMGKTLLVAFMLNDTTIGGVASTALKIALPVPFTAARAMVTLVRLLNGGTYSAAVAHVEAGGTVININTMSGANFSTGSTYLQGQIAIEVQG
jgi:hypothetical protein